MLVVMFETPSKLPILVALSDMRFAQTPVHTLISHGDGTVCPIVAGKALVTLPAPVYTGRLRRLCSSGSCWPDEESAGAVGCWGHRGIGRGPALRKAPRSRKVDKYGTVFA